jgi:propanediol dehydratase large subunit
MANPNIVNVATINGKTYSNVLTASNVLQVVNAASSGQIYKINSIVVSNANTTAAANVTLEVNNAAGNGTPYRIARGVTVPFQSSLVAIDRSTGLYLEENQSIKGFSTTSNSLEIIISYDIIS